MLSDPRFWLLVFGAAQLVFNWYTIKRQDAAEKEIRHLKNCSRYQLRAYDNLALRVEDLDRQLRGES